jgi:hypothetical protein
MNIHAEFRREENGRWIAEIPELPEARAHGSTRRDAALALAIRAFHILAERVASGELKVEDQPGGIILGGAAESLSELLLEPQRGDAPKAEPIPALEEGEKEDSQSFPRGEESPTTSSVAEASDSLGVAPVVAPKTVADYHRLRDMLEELIEKVGADESHPLAAYMDRVGTLVEQYENTHLWEVIESKQKR